MQIKNNDAMNTNKENIFHISFVPIFQLAECEENSRAIEIFDYIAMSGRMTEFENEGEQYLKCANINPQAKALTGFLINSVKNETKMKLYYSNKLLPRDLRACLEHFKKTATIKLEPLEMVENKSSFDSIPETFSNFNSSLLKKNEKFKRYFNFLAGQLSDHFKKTSKNNINSSRLIIIGTSYPMFTNFFAFLSCLGIKTTWFEFFELSRLSIMKSQFKLSDHSDISLRLNRISKVIKEQNENSKNKIKIVHLFPKFSHYEIEDYYFSKNIEFPFLSLEYTGGGTLSERDRIRLESFVKI